MSNLIDNMISDIEDYLYFHANVDNEIEDFFDDPESCEYFGVYGGNDE